MPTRALREEGLCVLCGEERAVMNDLEHLTRCAHGRCRDDFERMKRCVRPAHRKNVEAQCRTQLRSGFERLCLNPTPRQRQLLMALLHRMSDYVESQAVDAALDSDSDDGEELREAKRRSLDSAVRRPEAEACDAAVAADDDDMREARRLSLDANAEDELLREAVWRSHLAGAAASSGVAPPHDPELQEAMRQSLQENRISCLRHQVQEARNGAALRESENQELRQMVLQMLEMAETLRRLTPHGSPPRGPNVRANPVENSMRAVAAQLHHCDVDFERRLGGGSFGEVFRGTSHNVIRAFKFCNWRVKGRHAEATRQRLKKEAEHLKGLQENNYTVYCADTRELGDWYVFVFEFMQTDLGKVYNVHHFNELDGGFVFEKLVRIVNFLHNVVYLVHRDLKPDNILVRYSEQVTIDGRECWFLDIKVADFGFSTGIAEQSSASSNLGSYPFQAPETMDSVLRRPAPGSMNGRYPARGLDLWSMGAILYTMLHRHYLPAYRAFQRSQPVPQDYYDRQVDSVQGVPDACKRIMQKLLTISPSGRWGLEKLLNFRNGGRNPSGDQAAVDWLARCAAERPLPVKHELVATER